MQELLLGSWDPQIAAYSQQYPWRVFAAVLVATLLVLDLMFRKSDRRPAAISADLILAIAMGAAAGIETGVTALVHPR